MHRATPDRLTDETEIVWLVPTEDLDYVRESLEITKRATGRPAYTRAGRLIGYANLRPGTTSTRSSGRFDRRIFWLLPHDRSESPSALYQSATPLEAVDPRTVRAGVPGSLTDRARRGKSPAPTHP
ncbi:DUF6009 family protein [Streptomyces sp. NPDC050485]|uniref:DUF6009 family protein n=1 Tax=Streptomyces sp. NPDC050485 TaxID=3365617 RepID=UPI0037BAF2CD